MPSVGREGFDYPCTGAYNFSAWGVIIALAGLGVTVVKPLLALNTSIVKLTTRIDLMTDSLDKISAKNEKSHDRIWRHNDQQDATLDDHERRITVLEERRPRSPAGG